MIKSKELRGNLLLLIAAFIWGVAFVAQSAGAEEVGPFTFLSLRSFLGAAVLLPFIAFRSVKAKRKNEMQNAQKNARTLVIAGILCGIALCVASYFQQAGIAALQSQAQVDSAAAQDAISGKAGFITAMYILIVPLFGLFSKKKVQGKLWISVGMGIIALYLLSVKEGFSVSSGDVLLILCALMFAVHILVIDYYSPKVDGVKLACIQFFVTGLLALVPMLLIESPSFDSIKSAGLSIAYTGILSSGVGYTLQILGQKYTRPTVASLIMSLESVFAVLAGMVLSHEIPTSRESIGCVLMFAAIMLAQLPGKGEKHV